MGEQKAEGKIDAVNANTNADYAQQSPTCFNTEKKHIPFVQLVLQGAAPSGTPRAVYHSLQRC